MCAGQGAEEEAAAAKAAQEAEAAGVTKPKSILSVAVKILQNQNVVIDRDAWLKVMPSSFLQLQGDWGPRPFSEHVPCIGAQMPSPAGGALQARALLSTWWSSSAAAYWACVDRSAGSSIGGV